MLLRSRRLQEPLLRASAMATRTARRYRDPGTHGPRNAPTAAAAPALQAGRGAGRCQVWLSRCRSDSSALPPARAVLL